MIPVGLSSLLRNVYPALLLLVAIESPAAPPPAEAFASLPAVTEVVLSLDGQHLAWADNTTAEAQVITYDIAAAKVIHRFAIGKEMKLREVRWLDDEMLGIVLSQTEKQSFMDAERFRVEVARLVAFDITTGKGHVMLPGAAVMRWHTNQPKTIIMGTHQSVWTVDTRTGKGDVIDKESSGFTYGWVVDRDGKSRVRLDYEGDPRKEYRFLAKDGLGWRQIYSHKGEAPVYVEGLTADNSALIVLVPNAAGKNVVMTVALDGSGQATLFEDPQEDVEDVMTDRYSDDVIGVWLGGLQQEKRWLDKAEQARYERVARAFKGQRVELYGRSKDGNKVLARVDSPSKPGVYYLVDYAAKTANPVGDEYPALADVALGEVRAITYKARDGTSIPAYLTLPPGLEGKNLPLVVMPHGGPSDRDAYGFAWWTQFVASRGYAVLQPQFRGSTGFGEAFHHAGSRQWGGLMQDDVTDGVKAMIEQGIADPKRVCIVGASYGGFVALAGAAFTPDVYKCAVSVNGISNLPAFLAGRRAKYGNEQSSMRYWEANIGSIFDKNVIDRSPSNGAEQVRIPILLMHGVDDTQVPIQQSELMALQLDKFRKIFTLVRMDGEDHYLSRASTRIQVMKEIEKFLAANL